MEDLSYEATKNIWYLLAVFNVLNDVVDDPPGWHEVSLMDAQPVGVPVALQAWQELVSYPVRV